jgi:hypothetical protein
MGRRSCGTAEYKRTVVLLSGRQRSLLEDDMALAHPTPPADPHAKDAAELSLGPNWWIKDHLDSVIDAQLLKNRTESATDSVPVSEKGLLP